jgi:hypothetical protein
MKISSYAILISIALAFSVQCSFAQAMRNGLGDATTIIHTDQTLSSTGNPNEIGNFNNFSSGQDTGGFATRHLRSGNDSGIGGSFLGTTNVTAESSPARTGRIPETAVRGLIPTEHVNVAPTRLYSQSLNEPVSTHLPEISPDISSQWNPTLPSQSVSPASTSSTSVDFFAGHNTSPATMKFSNTMGLPSFDNY